MTSNTLVNKRSRIPVFVKGFNNSLKKTSLNNSSTSIKQHSFKYYPELSQNRNLSYIPINIIYKLKKPYSIPKPLYAVEENNHVQKNINDVLTPPASPQTREYRFDKNNKEKTPIKNKIPILKFNYALNTRRSYAHYINRKKENSISSNPRKSAILRWFPDQESTKSSQNDISLSIENNNFFKKENGKLKSCLKSKNNELKLKQNLRINQKGEYRTFDKTDNSYLLTETKSMEIKFSERYTSDAWEYMKNVYFI